MVFPWTAIVVAPRIRWGMQQPLKGSHRGLPQYRKSSELLVNPALIY